MKLLIGSRALKLYNSSYLSPDVKRTWDNDWVASWSGYEELKAFIKPNKTIPLSADKIVMHKDKEIHEVQIAWEGSSAAMLLDLAKHNKEVAFVEDLFARYSPGDRVSCYVALPNVCFTLKKSHRFLKNSPHFMKTMLDYRHLESMGCYVPEVLNEFYKLRVKETYSYKHPKLKSVSKLDFFQPNSGVPYKYDHDTIHLAVKTFDQPAYNYFKPNTAEVECSREMFEACSMDIKLASVLEESYVLALERSQIPLDFKVDRKKSFDIALEKVSSSITSGHWREFAWTNYFEVQKLYSPTYVDKFLAALESGLIKPFNTNPYPHMDK